MQLSEIISSYRDGNSINEIAEESLLSTRKIRKILSANSIIMRNHKEAAYIKSNKNGDPFDILTELTPEEEHLKAMALGLLPSAADIPGVREWLSPQSGYLFRQHDHEGLKALMIRLLQEQDPHQQMRKKNLVRVKQEAVFEENVAEELAIMERIAGGKRH